MTSKQYFRTVGAITLGVALSFAINATMLQGGFICVGLYFLTIDGL